jgi:DNA-binding response OmpR family regulator
LWRTTACSCGSPAGCSRSLISSSRSRAAPRRPRRLLGDGAPFDAVLLDIELPDQSGLDLLRGLRDAGDRTPVLILTGRDTDEDVVRGLDAGPTTTS